MHRKFATLAIAALLIWLVGCSSKPPAPTPTSTDTGSAPNAAAPKPPGLMAKLTAKPITLAEGTVLTVRVSQTISSKGSHAGDTFESTVVEPVEAEGKV